MDIGFAEALVILGLLLSAAAALSGWLHGTVLSISVLSVAARPAAVLLSFPGVRMPLPHKLFIAWCGPEGVASMLFAFLVLNSTAPDRTLVFDVASFAILASILPAVSRTPWGPAGSRGASSQRPMVMRTT